MLIKATGRTQNTPTRLALHWIEQAIHRQISVGLDLAVTDRKPDDRTYQEIR